MTPTAATPAASSRPSSGCFLLDHEDRILERIVADAAWGWRDRPDTPAAAGRLDRRRDLEFLRACPGVTGDFWDNELTTSGADPVASGEYLLSAN
jgi:hypothetical protein